jgi:hypothetical protein
LALRPIALAFGWALRSLTSAAIYKALAPNRFKDFWRD